MKRLKSIAFTVLVISLSLINKFTAQAQSVPLDSLLIKALATDELLPMLIDSAIKYSPEVRRVGNSQDYAVANLQVNKRAIYSAVSLLSSYNYGTNFTGVNNPPGTVGGTSFTTAQTSFYNVGIGFQLPVSYIVNRKNIIKAGQSLVNMAASEKENVALFIKQEVIRLYQDFKLYQKLMMISSKNKQAAMVNNSMAEKDFLNGQITVDQVSRVQDIYNKTIVEFETHVNKFQASYMQLEAYTGTSLSILIMRVK